MITPDRRTATLSFGLRLMPLERQFDVLRAMQRELDPPPGVRARLAGLPVLAAEANDRLASPWRRVVTLLAGLLAVALVLLVALRSVRRALIPLVPIALATGWSALVLFVSRIPLNPMSIVARRARDRDRDRVQRAAERALPLRARRRRTTSTRRCGARTRRRARRCSPRA